MFFLGLLTTGFAVLLRYIDRTIFQISYTITGVLIGPLTGLFVLGMMLPWATTTVSYGFASIFCIFSDLLYFFIKGAWIGQVIGTGISGWIALGGLLYGDSANVVLPTSTECCFVPENVTECPAVSGNNTLSTSTLAMLTTSIEK